MSSETPASLKAPNCDYRSRVRIEKKPIPPYIPPFPLTAGIVPIGNRPVFCYTAWKCIDVPCLKGLMMNNEMTISSRVIAKVCKKRHDHVLYDIRQLNQTILRMVCLKLNLPNGTVNKTACIILKPY